MRCRKCGATIVIDGASQAAANVPAPEPEAPAGDEGWTVNVDDGDQRTMSSEEVVQAFASRVIDEETFLWKDGMADWLPLKEVPELWDLCGVSGGVQTSGPTQVGAPTFPESNFGGGFGAFTGNGGSDTTEQALFDGGNLGQSPGMGDALFGSAETPAPSSALGGGAARRAGGRGVGADLFGGISKAGSDEDGGLVAAIPKDAKLTGARNENSVLFSLSALTDSKDAAPAASATTATTEGSGLIDIRALSASTSGGQKDSRVDDIMNLGGGGAFTPALTAPVLAPVSPDAMGDFLGGSSGETGAPGNKKMMYIIMGLVGLILVMFVVLIVSLTSKPDNVQADKESKSTRTATSVAAVQTASPAATPEPASTAAPTATGAAPKAPNVGSGGTGATSGGTKVATSGAGAKKPTEDPKEPVAAAPSPPANPGNFEDMMRKAAGKGGEVVKTTTTTSVAAPFDRGAAAASIGGIAGTLQSCKRGDPGAGRAKITFDPSTGSAKAVEIIEGPFSGTPTGGCVAGKFRGAKIPPFAPPEQSVVKSFSIN